jgi:hypothetical protein
MLQYGSVLKCLSLALLESRSEGGLIMAEVSSIITQLKVERDRVAKQLSGMEAALRAFASAYGGGASPGRRQISAAGKNRIAVAQRARWAKIRGESAKPKRTMSAASRRKIAAAQRARWAKFRKSKA